MGRLPASVACLIWWGQREESHLNQEVLLGDRQGLQKRETEEEEGGGL